MKKQLKEDLQKLYNEIQKCDEKEYATLNELKNMSSDLGLPRWCSWKECAEQLENREEKYYKNGCFCTYGERARQLLKEFYQTEGKKEILIELGHILAKSGYWK